MDAIEWDFREPGDLLRDSSGLGLELRPGSGAPRWEPDAEVGGALHFDGRSDYLRIDAADVGPLDMARAGDRVTVVALVRRESLDTGFIAGMWQEDDADPRRQYGLFLSLPSYGGAHQAVGHVSADGGPSIGLPYSRDYAASARMIAPGAWRVLGFSYDGSEIRAYLDGIADPRPHFREVGPPLGEGRQYAKNPYAHPFGLNRRNISDFTVGAVRLSAGMGNHFAGSIARLRIVPEALGERELFDLAAGWAPAGRPTLDLDFYRPEREVPDWQGGAAGEAWPLAALGFSSDIVGAVVTGDGLSVPAGGGSITLARLPGIPDHRIETIELEVVAGCASVTLGTPAGLMRSAPLGPGVHRVRVDDGWHSPTGLGAMPATVDALGVSVEHGSASTLISGVRLWTRYEVGLSR